MPEGAQFEEVIRVKLAVDSRELETAEARYARLQKEAKEPVAPRSSPTKPGVAGQPKSPKDVGQNFAREALFELSRGMQALSAGYWVRGIMAPRVLRKVFGYANEWGNDGTTYNRSSYPNRSIGSFRSYMSGLGGGSPKSPSSGPPPLPSSAGGAGINGTAAAAGGKSGPPPLPGSSGSSLGPVLAVTAVIAGAVLWKKAIGSTADVFYKSATKMVEASDHFMQGVVKADATGIMRGVLEGRVAGAYFGQGKMMLRYGAIAAGVGGVAGGVAGGMMGGPMGGASGALLGSGVGAAAGVGIGYLKGLPDVLSARLESFVFNKFASLMDSLVDTAKKYNGVAAAWSARYEVAQIQFTIKMAKAAEPLIASWMQLKLRVLEVVGQALPKLTPLIDWLAKKIDEMKGSLDKLPEQLLETSAGFLELIATTLELIDAFKQFIAWIEKQTGKVVAGAVTVATAPLLNGIGNVTSAVKIGRAFLGMGGTPGPSPIITPPAASPNSTSTGLANSSTAGLLREAAAAMRKQADVFRQQREVDEKSGKKSVDAGLGDLKNIMFMSDWRAFDKLHRDSFRHLLSTNSESVLRRQNAARQPMKYPVLPSLLDKPGDSSPSRSPNWRGNSAGKTHPTAGLIPLNPSGGGTLSPTDQALADQVRALGGNPTQMNNLLVDKIMLKNLAIYGTAHPHPLSDLNAIARANIHFGKSNEKVQGMYDDAKAFLYPIAGAAPDQKAPTWMSYQDWASKRGAKPRDPDSGYAPMNAPAAPKLKLPPGATYDNFARPILTDAKPLGENRYGVKSGTGIFAVLTDQQKQNLQQADSEARDPLFRSEFVDWKKAHPSKVPSPATPSAKSTPSKPPGPSSPQKTAKQPQPANLPMPQMNTENNFEMRLQNDRFMHESIAEVRDHLVGASKKMENEVRLHVAMLDGMTLGALL